MTRRWRRFQVVARCNGREPSALDRLDPGPYVLCPHVVSYPRLPVLDTDASSWSGAWLLYRPGHPLYDRYG